MKTLFFSKRYKIAVIQPCTERWDKMLPVPDGRFCESCSKSVVDFSNMSEREINERMRNAGPHMCGRFRKEQLDKTYTIQPRIQLSAQRRFFQYLITFLLGTKAFLSKATAQEDSLSKVQTDSLSLTQADSTLADTVALAIDDTTKLSVVSWDTTFEWPEINYTVATSVKVEWTLGCWAQTPVEPESPTILSVFDSIWKIFTGKSIPVSKKAIVKENPFPEKKTPVPPAKDQEPIVAVLSAGIKQESEEN